MLAERDYESLLESVADGAQVDWAALDAAAATSAERTRYRNLRLVARVAELHRTLVLDQDAESAAARIDEAAVADPVAWGHLRVMARMASGAFGRIYRAHDSQLNRDVALKLLRGDITLYRPVDRLLSEARTLAQVRHPNVVTVYGADVRDGRAGLWMELVEGQTLDAWLSAHGRMGAREAATIGMDLCGALAAVHAAGLVHGDVKPPNVMRENGGRIVLMDFGAGRAQDADGGGVAGTPMYLAPEVLAGGPPTTESDLYSLGVLLFHLLTRTFPFTGLDVDSLRDAHADADRRWLRDLRPDLPSELVQTIERALETDPARRFTSAGAMEQALQRGFVPLADARPSEATVHAPSRWPQLSFAVMATALVAAVVALVIWSRTTSNRGTVLSNIRTIAVPMVETSGPGIRTGFAAGLTEELISSLGQVHILTVKPGSSLGSINGKPDKEIVRALDVDALLKTTVSGSDGSDAAPPQLKVRARLLAAGTQAIVWSQDFDGPRGNSGALANAIAAAVTRAVQGVLTPAEATRLASSRQTSPQAEEAFLAGRSYIGRYGGGNADAALKSFQRALELDSQHAAAHAGAARAYVTLGANGAMPNAQARAAALAEAQQSLELYPNLADGHAVLAHIRFVYDWDWPRAEAEFIRSLDLNPSSSFALGYYANFLAALGRFDESLSVADTARQLDPQSSDAIRNFALYLYYKRDYARAERELLKSAPLEPNEVGLPLLRARFAETRGDFEGALADTREALRRSSGPVVPLRVAEIRREALAGRKAEALAGLTKLQHEADTRAIRVYARDLAYIQLALGNKTKAIELFEEAVNEMDPTVVWLGVDPRVDALRDEPRFHQILKTIGLPVGVGKAR